MAMGLSKDEVNLRRLLAAAPQQQNQAKLIHYVTTLREQLERLKIERTPEGLPRISLTTLNEYSEKIETLASKIAVPEPTIQEIPELFIETRVKESSKKATEESIQSPSGLRRRIVSPTSHHKDKDKPRVTFEDEPIKLDASGKAYIDKHRKLQDDLTDEMVELARQLKESSLMMNQSIQNTEKILDSTEKAVEHSLASTGHASNRAVGIYSQSSKTSCFTFLAIFFMTCVFIMVVLLIRVT